MQNAGAGLTVVGAERQAVIWLVRYGVAAAALLFFALGDVWFAFGMIALTEFILITMQRQPGFEASTYRPPAADRWQSPIAALRLASIVDTAWGIASGAVVLTLLWLIGLVALIIVVSTHHFGMGNLTVLVLYAAWLSTRPLWIGPLRQSLKRQANRTLKPFIATLYVGTQGVTIDLRPTLARRTPQRTYRFTVDYAELDEVRLMDGLTTQGYLLSMQEYDPTFVPRMEWEMLRYTVDQTKRPTILAMGGFGASLLLRSATLFYMVGSADQFGPAAVAAWQAWRAAHPLTAAPPA